MKIAAILVAAGTGTRFGHATPKQFCLVAGRPVMAHAAARLVTEVEWLQPVGDATAIGAALAGIAHLPPVAGGPTRQASVRAGLEALTAHAPDVVLVHDACRPFFPAGSVAELIVALGSHDGAIPAVPVSETLKRGTVDGRIERTVPRASLYRAQTPQAFPFAPLLTLHRAAAEGSTDDAGLVEDRGGRVALVAGDEDNVKITYAADLWRMERILSPLLYPRVGTGYDVHALAADRALVLCGIEVTHDRGLLGHSDADVGIHALCDAIYGALAEGDIGRHFPPSEATWKDADSARFLRHAAARIAARGGRLLNADVTLICERPKITPHAPAMMARLAELLGVDAGRVSVKATTSERLGFTGRMEGIAAQAVATVLLPD